MSNSGKYKWNYNVDGIVLDARGKIISVCEDWENGEINANCFIAAHNAAVDAAYQQGLEDGRNGR